MDFKQFLLLLIILVYSFIVFNYPFVSDESTFATIGKYMSNQGLYTDLPDNKPPAIYFTAFLLSKLPLNFIFAIRAFVWLTTLIVSYLTMKSAEYLFKPKKELLIFIPIFYIPLSVFCLGGLSLVTDTGESLFIALFLFLFIKYYSTNYKNCSLLVMSSLSLFIAFQYKQTALAFIFIPLLILLHSKKFKDILIFLFSFACAFIILLGLMNTLGILSAYLHFVWEVNFFERAASRIPTILQPSVLLNKIFLVIFALPLFLPVLFGIYKSYSRNPVVVSTIMLSILVIFLFILSISLAPTYRFYLLEIASPLLIFLPTGLENSENKKSLFKIFLFLSCVTLLALLLFSAFIFVKIVGVFDGYSIHDNIQDIQYLDTVSSEKCSVILSDSIYYWYGTSHRSMNVVYSLLWWQKENFSNETFVDLLSKNGTCFVDYFSKPFYHLSLDRSNYPTSNMRVFLEGFCKCDHFEQKTANSMVCYECGKHK